MFGGRERDEGFGRDRAGIAAEAGLDDALGDDGGDGGDEKNRGPEEKIVGHRRDHVGGIDQAGGLLGEAGDDHIGGRKQQVGGETAGDAGKRGGDAGDRVATDGEEERGAHREEQHVADVAGGVRHRAGEDDDQRQQPGRRGVHDQSEHRTEQAAVFGDGETEQTDQDGAEGGEVDEVGQQAENQALQSLDGEQVGDGDDFLREGIGDGEAELVADPRGKDHEHAQNNEERGRMREGVADALDAVEQALQPGRRRGSSHATGAVAWAGPVRVRVNAQKSLATAPSRARTAAKSGRRA